MNLLPRLLIALICLLVVKPLSAAPIPEYINNWLVLGAFDNDAQNAGFQKAWIDELALQPSDGLLSGGKSWTYFDDRLFSRNYDNYQDLYSYYKVMRKEDVAGKVVYAHTYIYSPKETPALLQIGADLVSKVWLNGNPVLTTTENQWRRSSQKAEVELQQGWNRVLVKVANVEDTRLGFYLSVADRKGQPLPDLTFSADGPKGGLRITTGTMKDIKTGNLPPAWREWPYVGAIPDPKLIYPPGSESSEKGWLLHAMVQTRGPNTSYPMTDANLLQAEKFSLQASGGTPPYAWSISGGELPPGLTLTTKGRIEGDVADYADLRKYTFTARVKDADGQVARKELTIDVKERPNKMYEEARLVALIHKPEFLSDQQIDELAKMMKEQGYQIGMPISYNNGELDFRYPSAFGPKGKRDVIGEYKKAFEKHGVTFGMYFGNLNLQEYPQAKFKDKVQHLVMEEAIRKYQPKALWFDWPTKEGEGLDALYSFIKTIDPKIVIVLNGHTNGLNGDWDSMSFEAWGAWGDRIWNIFPVDVAWPKKHAPESWRLMSETKADKLEKYFPHGPFLNQRSDWQEYLRLQLAMIGEGFIADIDHSLTLVGKMIEDFDNEDLVKDHRLMAAWASPAGKPPLYPSFTQVNPGPFPVAPWGYNLINTARDTIYLHILENVRGKKGLPGEDVITVGPVEGKVKSVTWMNENKTLPFLQRNSSTDRTVTIDLKGVKRDPIDTIIKIQLEKPLPIVKPAPIAQIPPGNLASFRPSRLLSNKGTAELIPSSGNFAQYGNDGKAGTWAVAGGEYAFTYEVDLGRVYPVKQVAVTFGKIGFATEYEILVSDDGKSWTSVAKNQAEESGRYVSDFAPTEARYVRVKAIMPNNEKQKGIQMSVAELEVYQ